MDAKSVAFKVIHLPKNYYTEKNSSLFTLLNETGYFDLDNHLDEDNFVSSLKQYPECINDWLIWSDNKRTRIGWYFGIGADQNYFVGYFPNDIIRPEKIFNDGNEACAYFIKQEIESIRKYHS